jgi:hypothetical protein
MESNRLKTIFGVFLIGVLISVLAFALHQFPRPRIVPFTVIEEGYSLVAKGDSPRQESEPAIIVVASPEDLHLPVWLTLPESLAKRLEGIDFAQSIVILARRGQQQDSGIIQKVEQQCDKVIIHTNDLIIGPGNYVIEGWTQLYEVISITKESLPYRNVRFVLQRETQGNGGETEAFIP